MIQTIAELIAFLSYTFWRSIVKEFEGYTTDPSILILRARHETFTETTAKVAMPSVGHQSRYFTLLSSFIIVGI
jgi:hypothetical protein